MEGYRIYHFQTIRSVRGLDGGHVPDHAQNQSGERNKSFARSNGSGPQEIAGLPAVKILKPCIVGTHQSAGTVTAMATLRVVIWLATLSAIVSTALGGQ